jgi:hypothetical protein
MVKKRGRGCGEIEVMANPDCVQRGIARAAFGYLAQARSAPPPVLIFVKDPLGIEGLSFNMAIKFQVSEDQNEYVFKKMGGRSSRTIAPRETKGRTAWQGQHRFARCCNVMDV